MNATQVKNLTMSESELKAEAAKYAAKKEASFRRCDTDGFLTQWANGMLSEKNREQAKIAANGGMAEFPCLITQDGERVDAEMKTFKCQYTYSDKSMWLLSEKEAAKYGRKWIPMGKNSRVQKKLGLAEGTEMAPAEARINGSGMGYVEVRRLTKKEIDYLAKYEAR